MSVSYRELVEKLAAPVPELREQAKRGLIAAGKAAVPALVDGLGHAERDIRAGSALCLGRIGFAGAARVLAAMADQDPDPSVRPLALRALTDLAGPEAPAAVRDALLHHLGSKDMFARALACRGLGRIGDDGCRAALQRAMGDEESWVRDAARAALAPPGAPPPAEPDPGPATTTLARTDDADPVVVDRLLAQLASPDVPVQREAQRRLVGMGETALEAVSRLLGNELSPARRPAVEVLGAIGGARAMRSLAALLEEPNASALRAPVLHAMARALQQAPLTGALPRGVRGLLEHDPDPLVRAAAARALVFAGGIDRRLALELGIQDTEDWVRLSAVAALGEAATPADRDLAALLVTRLDGAAAGSLDPELPPHLLGALCRILADGGPAEIAGPALRAASFFIHDDDPTIRRVAGELLARLAGAVTGFELDEPTLTGLVELVLECEDPGRRIPLIRAVGRLAGPTAPREAVDALARVVQERAAAGPAEAREAARALVALGNRGAVGVLVDLANSKSGPAVAVAATALAAMDPRAEIVGARGADGKWEVRIQHWCECGGALDWTRREREELRCLTCDREYVLAAAGKLYAADRAPLGVCLCPECRRKQPLIRRPGGQALFCPVSGRVHIRPFDHPRQIRLLSDLPLGACTCCAEPQPLIRHNEDVVCYRTRELYRPTPTGFALAGGEVVDPADHVAAINEALMAGSIGVGQSGLATAGVIERAERNNPNDNNEED